MRERIGVAKRNFVLNFVDMKKGKKLKYKPEVDKKEEKDFLKDMGSQIKKNNHVEYFEGAIKNFNEYKKFISENLLECEHKMNTIYRVKFTYVRQKNVWREFEVFEHQTLEEITESLLDSMEWDNDHLHAYHFGDWYSGHGIYSPHIEDESWPTLKTSDVPIASIDFSKNKKMYFVFDFGDDHRFHLEFVSTRLAEKKDDMDVFPKLVDIRGVGPEQYPALEE